MPNLFIFHVQLFSRDMQGHHFYIENINRKGDIISHKNWKKTENGENTNRKMVNGNKW